MCKGETRERERVRVRVRERGIVMEGGGRKKGVNDLQLGLNWETDTPNHTWYFLTIKKTCSKSDILLRHFHLFENYLCIRHPYQ